MGDESKKSTFLDSAAQTENDARLNLLYEIGRILASEETLNEAAPQILEAICRNLRFEFGELWRLNKEETILRLESVWHLSSPPLEKFASESRQFRFVPGEGLPGKAWAKNEPLWIENLNVENNIPRHFLVGETGLQSGFAFPIRLGETFLGAFSFFSRERREPNESLLQMFTAVGSNIGQFIKREQIEGSLRESEDRYRAFIKQSTEGIWRFEFNEKFSVRLPIEKQIELAFRYGYLAECNDAMARMYGLEKAEDLVGNRISDLLDMSDEANVEYFHSFIESGYNLTDAESHEKDANGNDVFFLNSLVGVIENENLIRVWGTQRDITVQKRAERALLESEESYRIVAETASDAIIKIDTDSQVLFVNTAVERIFGYRAEEMLGQSLTMIMPEDLRERHRAGFQRYLETGKRHLAWTGIEIPARHADGHIFPLEISFGEYNENGKRFFIGIARDITERKQSEIALRESEANFRQLAEAVPQIVWVTEADGSLSYVNEQWVEFSGLSLEQTNDSQMMNGIFHPDDVERLAEEWKKSFANGEVLEIEIRMRNRSGAYRWFLTRSRPAKDKDGKILKWFGTSTDITDSKQAENRLAVVAEISEMTRASESPDDLLFAVSQTLGEHLQVRRCLFNEIDLVNDRETVHRDYCRGVESVAGVHRISDYSSVTSADMIAGKTVVNCDSKIDSRTAGNYARVYEPNGERSYIAIPLLRENRWVASLWISDDEPRQWSRQEISLLETVAERTWTAIEKLRINYALRESEERYRSLFETMDEGFCLCEMIFNDEGKPVDYRFLETNPAFERMTGLKKAEGKTARELVPNLEAHWFEIYGSVVLSGEAIRFMDGSDAMNRWFDVYASRVGGAESRRFAILFTDITERRRIENERERFLAVGSDLQVINGIDGYFKWVSPAWERNFGWTAQEMTTKPWRDFVHPDDYAATVEEAENAYAGADTLSFENRYLHKDGTYRWLSWRAKTIVAENLIYAVATDITKRRRAEEKLRESEERFRLLTENAEDYAIIFLDTEARITKWNVGAERILGWSESEIVGQPGEIIFTPEDRAALLPEKELETAIEQGNAKDERWHVRKDGSRLYAFGEMIALYDDAENLRGFAKLFRDLSERKRVEDALRESEEKFRIMANSISQFAWMADAEGDIFWYNERWFEYTGTTFDEMQGWGWKSVHHPDHVERVTEKFKRHLASGEPWEDTFPLRGADGEYRWFLSRALPIRDAEGKIVRWFGTNTDITERKEIEAERERLLMSEQRARTLAEDANRAKDEFIALVSHELRSPLNAMLGWTRILQNQKPDEQTTNYAFDVIVRNARSQSKLIEDLLDIARVGEKKLRLEMQPTELAPIINAAVEIIKPAAEEKNISISQSLDRTANFILGDDERLRQVIDNLLSNAVKFTPDGGTIDIRLERGEGEAKIIVSDTGQGFSPKFLPQMFERFKQADASATRRHGGLGIGLSLARDLVELHGGTIAAQSAGEGKGATFTVSLPLRTIAPIKENSSKRENMNAQGKLNGFWILAVDDEADARELVSFMLQINGARVTTANSAVEALDILKNSDGRLPDILLSDISMPNESGYALLEKIRSLPPEHGGQIPAVALTAFNRPEDREAAFDAGFQKHLGKPVEPEDLISAIIETAGK